MIEGISACAITHTHTHADTHIHTHADTNTHTHTQADTHIHTNTHTHKQECFISLPEFDRPIAEMCTLKHTTLVRTNLHAPLLDSNLQYLQLSVN